MNTRSPHRTTGFTLVEMVLALGLASVFLVGIFTVLSSGITSSSDANNDARVSLILRDIANRMQGSTFVDAGTSGLVSALPDQYYNVDGRWVDQEDSSQVKENMYKVVVKKGKPFKQPDNFSDLMTIVVEVYWPVEPKKNGAELSAKAKVKFSYQVAPLTGEGWKSLDSNFIPKIEG